MAEIRQKVSERPLAVWWHHIRPEVDELVQAGWAVALDDGLAVDGLARIAGVAEECISWLAVHGCPVEWVGVELTGHILYTERTVELLGGDLAAGADPVRASIRLRRLCRELTVAVDLLEGELELG